MFSSVFSALRFAGCALGLLLASHDTAQAQKTVVVELFTSQGCSSCPAADRVLGQLSGQPGVLTLTLNVDYWDYLGWKDDLALQGNSLRQRAYARMMRSRNVYTPQMMLDGKMDVVGSRKRDVLSAVNAYVREPDPVPIAVIGNRQGQYRVQARPTALPREAVIWVVGYDRSVSRNIEGGENSGRTVTYTNVVREWREAGRWSGREALNLAFDAPAGNGGMTIIVQQDGVGPILGAAQISY